MNLILRKRVLRIQFTLINICKGLKNVTNFQIIQKNARREKLPIQVLTQTDAA